MPLAVIALVAIALLPNRPLVTRTASQQLADEAATLETADATVGPPTRA